MVAIRRVQSDYGPAELKAILDHKYFLGIERRHDPSFEEAAESWEDRYAARWRTHKMRCDAEAQVREIEYHRQAMCCSRGCEVSFTEAAREWVLCFSASWRHRREREWCSGGIRG